MRFLSRLLRPIRIAGFFMILFIILGFPRVAFLQLHLNPPTIPTSGNALRLKEAALRGSENSDPESKLNDPSLGVRKNVSKAFGLLPMNFEVNEGQADSRARFLSHGNGYSLFLTSDEAVLALRKPANHKLSNREQKRQPLGLHAAPTASSVLRIKMLNANPSPELEGLDEQLGHSNYFIGNDRDKWRTDVKHYGRVKYKDIYPGVSLVYYGNQHQLEYDFVVAAGADPGLIRVGFKGTRALLVDAEGNLILHTASGVIRQQKPSVYQEMNGTKAFVAANYVLKGKREVGFRVGEYDRSKPLIIDPALNYSSYLFGNGDDFGGGIRVDNQGNVYLTGWTGSTDFPTLNPIQNNNSGFDAFVTKLNATGSALIYSTYLGGSDDDEGFILAVDGAGSAYVTGLTQSTDFPLSVQPFQSMNRGAKDVFVTKLNAAGNALIYSTYLGGNGDDVGYSIAVDSAGNAYLDGATLSTNFPINGALQSIRNAGIDGFVTKLNAAGSGLVFSTYLGGNGDDFCSGLTLDSAANIYLVGETFSTNFPTVGGSFQTLKNAGADGFVTKMNTTGSMLFFSTYLGGNGDDEARGIAIDSAGNSYLTGYTGSTNFPTTFGALRTSFAGGTSDSFVTKLNTNGTGLSYSTYLGGTGTEFGDCTSDCIAVDAFGNASVIGRTNSIDFPVVNAFQSTNRGAEDGFITKLSSTGTSAIYSSYLGGNSDDDCWGIALSSSGTAFVTGRTFSVDFPTTPGAFQTTFGAGFDAFVSKIASGGRTRTGVFRPSTGELFLKNANSSGFADTYIIFGNPSDYPLAGDWNGDGIDSVGIYRNGVFYLRNTNSTGFADIVAPFGSPGDQPVAGDWNGDGVDTIGVYRNGTFYLRNSNTAGPPDLVFTLGNPGDVGIAGDWNGDGVTTCGVFRPSNGIVYLRNSNTTGFADLSFVFGNAGDKPVAGDWNGDGIDTIGIYRNGVFYLSNSNATGFADLVFALGNSGDFPIAGNWNGAP